MIYTSTQQAALATSIALTAIRQSHGNLDLGDDKVVSVIETLQDNWLGELKPSVKMDCNPNDILVFTYIGFSLSIQIKERGKVKIGGSGANSITRDDATGQRILDNRNGSELDDTVDKAKSVMSSRGKGFLRDL